VNSKWAKVMLLSAATSAFLVYDITTATEAPRLMLAYLQYTLLGLAMFSLLGSAVMYASGR
jgi:hypothetical protein